MTKKKLETQITDFTSVNVDDIVGSDDILTKPEVEAVAEPMELATADDLFFTGNEEPYFEIPIGHNRFVKGEYLRQGKKVFAIGKQVDGRTKWAKTKGWDYTPKNSEESIEIKPTSEIIMFATICEYLVIEPKLEFLDWCYLAETNWGVFQKIVDAIFEKQAREIEDIKKPL